MCGTNCPKTRCHIFKFCFNSNQDDYQSRIFSSLSRTSLQFEFLRKSLKHQYLELKTLFVCFKKLGSTCLAWTGPSLSIVWRFRSKQDGNTSLKFSSHKLTQYITSSLHHTRMYCKQKFENL